MSRENPSQETTSSDSGGSSTDEQSGEGDEGLCIDGTSCETAGTNPCQDPESTSCKEFRERTCRRLLKNNVYIPSPEGTNTMASCDDNGTLWVQEPRSYMAVSDKSECRQVQCPLENDNCCEKWKGMLTTSPAGIARLICYRTHGETPPAVCQEEQVDCTQNPEDPSCRLGRFTGGNGPIPSPAPVWLSRNLRGFH